MKNILFSTQDDEQQIWLPEIDDSIVEAAAGCYALELIPEDQWPIHPLTQENPIEWELVITYAMMLDNTQKYPASIRKGLRFVLDGAEIQAGNLMAHVVVDGVRYDGIIGHISDYDLIKLDEWLKEDLKAIESGDASHEITTAGHVDGLISWSEYVETPPPVIPKMLTTTVRVKDQILSLIDEDINGDARQAWTDQPAPGIRLKSGNEDFEVVAIDANKWMSVVARCHFRGRRYDETILDWAQGAPVAEIIEDYHNLYDDEGTPCPDYDDQVTALWQRLIAIAKVDGMTYLDA